MDEPEHRVTFVPQLFLQRRAWALDVVRRESPVSVLDVGCGEGSLISCLANAAACLPPTSSEHAYPEDIFEIHVKKTAGLDINEKELEYAVKSAIVPDDEENKSPYMTCNPRWTDLQIKIWHGGLEWLNPEFVYNEDTGQGYECIISTEVIEHLPPDVFPYFAYMLLGQYHPRLLAITTPNYTYNARFDKAARDQGLDPRAQGYPDPTGRTDRVFRHDDHKFEWTTEEFTEYCQTEAKKYGYAVDITGVGNCMEGGDTHLGYASLCALFKRERGAPVEAAIAKPAPAALSATPHSLLCEQQYTAHISSGKPAPYADIIAEVKDGFKRCNDDTLSLQDLWNQRSLTIACGGRPEEIYKAVAKHGSREDKWAILDEGKKWTVKVKWGAFVKSEDPWAEDPPDSDDDGIGEDWEDLDERRDLEQSYVGAGTWEMKMGATALHWNTADLEASMKSWGTKSSGSTSGGWGRIESAEAEDEDPEWTNGSFSQSPPKRSPLSKGQKKR